MQLNDNKVKKLIIILNVTFLVILAVIIAGFASYRIDSKNKLETMKEQIEQLSSMVSLIENPSPGIKDSIDELNRKVDQMRGKMDEISQKPDENISDRQVDYEIQSALDDIAKRLSELNKQVETLKAVGTIAVQPVEQEKEPVKEQIVLSETVDETEEEAIAVPDEIVPGSPAIPEDQVQDSNTIKAGQNIIVTVKANEISNLYGYQFNLNYDNAKVTFKGNLKSAVDGINTIFSKNMNDYLLVGATMIGDMPGYSGQNETICTMEFTANEDIDSSIFTISNVNTVDADQNYIEDNSGWSIDVKAES